jgi:putative transposase
LPRHFPNVRLDAFVVMPNHFHGIIIIDPIIGATRPSPVGATHPSIVGATHPLQDIDTDGNDPTPDQARIGADGSPLRMPARDNNDGSPRQPMRPDGPPTGSLGAMIGQFKSRATKRIWTLPGFDRIPIWQRNYYEHIIRDDLEYQQFIQYIQANPLRWQEDQLNSSALSIHRKGDPTFPRRDD